MDLPYLLNILVVLFFGDLLGWGQRLHDFWEAVLMSPVTGSEAVGVADVFDVGRVVSQNFHELEVAVPCRDVQTREAHLVFDLWVAAVVHELLDGFVHVTLGGQMQR